MQTPNEFCHWLRNVLEETSLNGPNVELLEVYEKLQEVILSESVDAVAIGHHEEYMAYIRAGFTAPQAFNMIQSKHYAMHHGMAVGLASNNRPPEHG